MGKGRLGLRLRMWQFQAPRLRDKAKRRIRGLCLDCRHYLLCYNMTSPPAITPKEDDTLHTPMQDSEVNNLIESIARVSVQDGDSGDTSTSKSEHVSSQPLRVYTRSQVLYLRDSPLVRPPEGMPSLKDWFGYVCQCCERTPHHRDRFQRLE